MTQTERIAANIYRRSFKHIERYEKIKLVETSLLTANECFEVAEQTALEFTKWKDENYIMSGNFNEKSELLFYKKEGSSITLTGKTSEQLFNEWNDLNNK